MSTSRRQFLSTLAGLAVAPFALSRVLAAKAAPVNPPIRDSLNRAKPLDNRCDYPGRAIKVPSNRRYTQSRHGEIPYYHGDWDGTFKLEVCDNPAYVLADLWEQQGNLGRFGSGKGFDWHAIYDYGQFCDELVVDIETEHLNPRWVGGTDDPGYWKPRITLDTCVATQRRIKSDLRDALSMHYRVFLATDPRYQRSFPV